MSNPLLLLFRQAPKTNPADLIFGETDAASTDAPITLAVTLPAPEVAISLAPSADVSVDVSFPAPEVSIGLRYAVDVSRPLLGEVVGRHQEARALPASVSDTHPGLGRMPTPVASRHNAAVRAGREAVLPLPARFIRSRTEGGGQHAEAVRAGTLAGVRHQDMLRTVRLAQSSGHAETIRLRLSVTTDSQDRYRDRRPELRGRTQQARPLSSALAGTHSKGLPWAVEHRSRSQEAIRPPWGISAVVPPQPDLCYTPSPRLVFMTAPGTPTLIFRCDEHDNPPGHSTIIVPIRRTYMVLNDVSLRRVTGDIPLPATGMSITLDYTSWTFGFSAGLPASAMQYLGRETDGSPALLEASVNGTTFRFLAESRSRSRQFPRADFTVRGRGIAAVLDDPYAPAQSFTSSTDRTVQQLIAHVLTVNGVSLGWDVDFGITDWLVPGGTWAFQGSHIAALNDIAGAAGAYLQPHPTAETLRLLPLYPSAPWDWGSVTPDFILPASVMAQENIDWLDKAAYNSIVVAGTTSSGVLGNVKRQGTAGDLPAPMFTHPLITHVDAARQRGMATLADTGAQARVGLRLPVLPATGIIMPGKFVSYVDGSTSRFGLTRSVDVQIAGGDVWQTLVVETHE